MVRILFAVLSSIHTPACISLINDYFKHEKRSRANSLYVAAVSIGVGFANLTSIINFQIGWRLSSVFVSTFGLIITILTCFIHEPRR